MVVLPVVVVVDVCTAGVVMDVGGDVAMVVDVVVSLGLEELDVFIAELPAMSMINKQPKGSGHLMIIKWLPVVAILKNLKKEKTKKKQRRLG